MRIPETPGAAPAPIPAWLAWATDRQGCLGAFARFGIGFNPELIAAFDATRSDDAPAACAKAPIQ